MCRDEILNVVGLKKQLYNTFHNTPSYNSDGHEDAAVPYWHIVNCLPVLEKKFMIKVKKVWKCLVCQYEETKLEDLSSEVYIFLQKSFVSPHLPLLKSPSLPHIFQGPHGVLSIL